MIPVLADEKSERGFEGTTALHKYSEAEALALYLLRLTNPLSSKRISPDTVLSLAGKRMQIMLLVRLAYPPYPRHHSQHEAGGILSYLLRRTLKAKSADLYDR